ncbi:MAG TPA: dihydroorotate dehydrogenase electron transfer subunit [Armatimonadota bacterium]|nr:dihydroorotate dehydrogenase electron transfer subunit [Armatimonadota bacterium]
MTASPLTNTSPIARHLRLPIIEHSAVGPGVWRMVLGAPELAEVCSPGQFLHVLCHSGNDPLLRRPFSIHDADPKLGLVSLLYQVVGRGTRLLAERVPGEALDVLGPLGRGFALPETAGQPILLVGGGMAVAPLYFLARKMFEFSGNLKISILLGARTKDMLLCLDELASLRIAIQTATEDASHGHHGLVTGLLESYLEEGDKPLVYACGPWPMLKAVAEITKAHKLDCQVSTEAKMACGVGACMSCVIKVRDGDSSKYVRSCKEGPVFDADEVIWDE